MYCTKCGFKNNNDAKFCENCGFELDQQRVPKGKPFKIIFPAIVNLISAVILSLIGVGIIIFVIVIVTKAISSISFFPIDFYGLGGNLIIFFTIAIVFSLLLPIIIANYLAFKGLMDSEASGYKWGLITAFYGLLPLLLYYSMPESPWFLGLILIAIPFTSITCLLMDDNLIKFTTSPTEIVLPAILSLVLFYGILHLVIISTVTLAVSLVSSIQILSILHTMSSIAEIIPGVSSSAVSAVNIYYVVLPIILIALVILLLVLFYKLGKNLLNRRSKVYILGIIIYSLITLSLISFYAEGKFINIIGLLLILLFGFQVILLSLKSTRMSLNS